MLRWWISLNFNNKRKKSRDKTTTKNVRHYFSNNKMQFIWTHIRTYTYWTEPQQAMIWVSKYLNNILAIKYSFCITEAVETTTHQKYFYERWRNKKFIERQNKNNFFCQKWEKGFLIKYNNRLTGFSMILVNVWRKKNSKHEWIKMNA